MLSPKSPIPSPSPDAQPTHSCFLALAFRCTGAYNLCKTKGLSSHWWPTSSYCCSSYRVADPFSILGTFSSSSIGSPVFHPIDDCEHPLLHLPGTGLASQETAISGSCPCQLDLNNSQPKFSFKVPFLFGFTLLWKLFPGLAWSNSNWNILWITSIWP